MKVKSEREVAQSCPTLSDPMDCSPPGSSVHGIFQARVLESIKCIESIKNRNQMTVNFLMQNQPMMLKVKTVIALMGVV